MSLALVDKNGPESYSRGHLLSASWTWRGGAHVWLVPLPRGCSLTYASASSKVSSSPRLRNRHHFCRDWSQRFSSPGKLNASRRTSAGIGVACNRASSLLGSSILNRYFKICSKVIVYLRTLFLCHFYPRFLLSFKVTFPSLELMLTRTPRPTESFKNASKSCFVLGDMGGQMDSMYKSSCFS